MLFPILAENSIKTYPNARPALCLTNSGICATGANLEKKNPKKHKATAASKRKAEKCKKALAHKKKIKGCKVKKTKKVVASSKVSNPTPSGYGPVQLRKAYNLPTQTPLPQTIAIVAAYDNPRAESDLKVYSKTFSLPICSSANGCFRKVNIEGEISPLPTTGEKAWLLETSLDIQLAHGICPNCKILLVETSSASVLELAKANDTAVSLGATEISNSWVVDEFASETSLDSHFNHPGIAITTASGDKGYKAQWPAASSYVTAVGGTVLTLDENNNRASEIAWEQSGSGCSAYEGKPAWQIDSDCVRRMIPDVSIVASGVAVYSSWGIAGQTGWIEVGGTSVGTPMVAAIYALAGNAAQVVSGSYPYSHSSSFFDIQLGDNGTCSPAYFCQAEVGYDGPSGLGSPRGIGGF